MGKNHTIYFSYQRIKRRRKIYVRPGTKNYLHSRYSCAVPGSVACLMTSQTRRLHSEVAALQFTFPGARRPKMNLPTINCTTSVCNTRRKHVFYSYFLSSLLQTEHLMFVPPTYATPANYANHRDFLLVFSTFCDKYSPLAPPNALLNVIITPVNYAI